MVQNKTPPLHHSIPEYYYYKKGNCRLIKPSIKNLGLPKTFLQPCSVYQSMSKMKKKKTTVDTFDRILQLPEHLQNRILSSLSLKDAIRTSVLAKRWTNLWITSLTKLEFDKDFFNVKSSNMYVYEILEGMLNWVERTLLFRHTQKVSLEKLVIHVPFYRSTMASCLDRCIRYALECNVKNLDLSINSNMKFMTNMHYTLPQTVFAATKSITNLSIYGCKFECSNLNMCSLKTLNLEEVCVDGQTIQNMIANCPVIEDLSLNACDDSKVSLKICGLVNPYLVMVKVWYCQFEKIEINAPGLQSFSFVGSEEELPCEINVSNWENIRELSLNDSSITDEWLRDNVSNLPFLETLSLVNCNMLENIKIVSRRLKHFVVEWCGRLIKVEIDDPNLSSFNCGGENMISLSTNALALHRVELSLYPPDELLGKLNNVKVLKFDSELNVYAIVPKELRNSLLPPLHNFKHLTLKYNEDWSSEEVEEIVDGAVWFSSHPVTCYTSATHKNGVRFKFRK